VCLSFNLIFFTIDMARVSLDTSKLPQDVLTYTNKRFSDFIQNFCGKDEADLGSTSKYIPVGRSLFRYSYIPSSFLYSAIPLFLYSFLVPLFRYSAIPLFLPRSSILLFLHSSILLFLRFSKSWTLFDLISPKIINRSLWKYYSVIKLSIAYWNQKCT